MLQLLIDCLYCPVQVLVVCSGTALSGAPCLVGRDIAHHDLLSTEVLSSSAVSSEQRGTVQSRAVGPYWDLVRR